ncbi:MAG TPA: enoyl-CoA hydratase-related protein [Sphingomicrobium sp.]|nr:enoyl-CoA hydratase-related protein [Sphingomicrobium sp.]
MSEHVRVADNDGCLAISLARPERRNAITSEMYAALADAIEEATGNHRVRVITISGDGQDFTAGNDLADFLEAAPRSSPEIPVWRFLRALARCETPIIAAVHGNCVGIGTTLLLHCDLVLADDTARFSMPFVDLGLVPEAASSLLVPRLAGRRRAARYLLLCESFGPDEALTIGLISHRAQPGELEAELKRLVANLLSKPAEALRQTQKLLRHGARDEVLERMELEGTRFSERLASVEVQQAISAFFQKRGSAAS